MSARRNGDGKGRGSVGSLTVPGRNGGKLKNGNPGNRGGGRPPEIARADLAKLRDDLGWVTLKRILEGVVPHNVAGKCSHCKKDSVGLDATELARLLPTPELQAKVAEATYRHTLPREVVIRFEGVPHAQEALETIRSRIRAKLPQPSAEDLLADIDRQLRPLRIVYD